MKTTAAAPTVAQLTACSTRDAARALLPLALSRPQLLALAAEVHVAGASRLNKSKLVEEIVSATVGSRLTTDAILAERPRPIPADAVDLRPAPGGPVPAEITSRSHARLAADMRRTTMALLAGEATDPAVTEELYAAAAELAKAAARRRQPADNRAVALKAVRDAKQPSGWSAIATVRDSLTHLGRTAQDDLLIGMVRDGLVHAIPVANAKALSAWDHATALLLGGQWTHAVQAAR